MAFKHIYRCCDAELAWSEHEEIMSGLIVICFPFFFLQLEIQFSSGPPVVPHNDPRVALGKLEIPPLTYLTATSVLRSENDALALWSYYKYGAASALVRLHRKFHLILIILCLPSEEGIIRIVIGRRAKIRTTPRHQGWILLSSQLQIP